jgi:hypothetical protein
MEDKASKIFIILGSLLESKARYIEISKDGEPIFKVKLITETEDMVEFLDGFFDNGFTVKEISKKEFDDFEGIETLKFNI